jgi:hypothetical protein
VTYDDLAEEITKRFPPLVARVAQEQELWDPDPVGGDVLLADIFVPFFVEALRSRPESLTTVQDAARFIEELAASENVSLQQAVRISVLQALEDYVGELPGWIEEFGPATRSLLPTRRPTP